MQIHKPKERIAALNVRINMIAPGATDIELHRSSAVAFPNPDTVLDEDLETIFIQRTGIPRMLPKLCFWQRMTRNELRAWFSQ